jgi:hypothetical protein
LRPVLACLRRASGKISNRPPPYSPSSGPQVTCLGSRVASPRAECEFNGKRDLWVLSLPSALEPPFGSTWKPVRPRRRACLGPGRWVASPHGALPRSAGSRESEGSPRWSRGLYSWPSYTRMALGGSPSSGSFRRRAFDVILFGLLEGRSSPASLHPIRPTLTLTTTCP